MCQTLTAQWASMEHVQEEVLNEQTLEALKELGQALRAVHNRLIAERSPNEVA